MFYFTCTESKSFTFWNITRKNELFHDILIYWDAPVHHSALRVTQTTDFNLMLTCRDEQYFWYVYLKLIIEIQKYFAQFFKYN